MNRHVIVVHLEFGTFGMSYVVVEAAFAILLLDCVALLLLLFVGECSRSSFSKN